MNIKSRVWYRVKLKAQGSKRLPVCRLKVLSYNHPFNSNIPSYPSNRSRGRGNYYQSRNNTNQHHGNSRFFVCNNQSGGYLCTRRIYEGTNFCPGCGVPTQNHPSRGGHLPVRRGGRAIGRGRGRGNFRGGYTGTHRGH